MLTRFACWSGRILPHSLQFPRSSSSYSSRTSFSAKCFNENMSEDTNLLAKARRRANFRLSNVSGYTSEILEIQADAPSLHVLFIPGNPGVALFYKEFVEFLYELLGGTASVTAIGHVSQTAKNWEHGQLFSLQEQIDHKINFIREEMQNVDIPILLVGHSIGSYISIEMFKKSPEKVKYCVGLYPFLTLNPHSVTQSQVLAAGLSYRIASLGLLPIKALRFIVRNSLGKSWSANAVEAACSHLSQYHTMRNALYMAMTEFEELSEKPDWTFIRERKDVLAITGVHFICMKRSQSRFQVLPCPLNEKTTPMVFVAPRLVRYGWLSMWRTYLRIRWHLKTNEVGLSLCNEFSKLITERIGYLINLKNDSSIN